MAGMLWGLVELGSLPQWLFFHSGESHPVLGLQASRMAYLCIFRVTGVSPQGRAMTSRETRTYIPEPEGNSTVKNYTAPASRWQDITTDKGDLWALPPFPAPLPAMLLSLCTRNSPSPSETSLCPGVIAAWFLALDRVYNTCLVNTCGRESNHDRSKA